VIGHPWGGSQPPSSPLCGDVITLTGFDSEKETIDGLITIAKAVDERI